MQPRTTTRLKRLESYAGTDLRYITKGIVWLGTSSVVSSITGLVSSIAFAYFVPKDIFGMYQYVLTIVSILTIITLPKINRAMKQAVSRGLEGELSKSLRVRIRWGVLASFAGFIIAAYYLIKGNSTLAGAIGIASAFVWFFDSIGIGIAYLKAKLLFREVSLHKAALRIIGLALMVLVIWQTSNLWLIILAYFCIYGSIKLISYLIIRRLYPPNTKEDKDSIRYGKSLSFLSMFKAAVLQLDKILVFHYLGAAELAIYFFVIAPVDQIRSAMSSLDELAFPKFSSAKSNVLRKTLVGKLLKLEFLIILPIVIAYILLIPYIFPLAFPNYAEYVWYTQIYAISLLFFPALLLSTALVAQKKERAVKITNITSPILRLVILIPAVKTFGLTGMVLGVVIVSALNLTMQTLAFKYSPWDVTNT